MARVLALGLLLAGYMAVALISFGEGQRFVRQRTVVAVGSPYYRGVYHGECAPIVGLSGEPLQACATEKEP